MSQPDPEAINLGDETTSKQGTATGYGIPLSYYPGLYLVISRLFYRGWTGSDNPRDPQRRWQTSQVDGSGHLFSMYVDVASEKDTYMANSWKGDADGILVFVSPDTTLLLVHQAYMP